MKATDLIRDCKTTETADGGTVVTLQSQVDPEDYKVFKTIAEYAGGTYVNKKTGHSFLTPPRLTLHILRVCAETVDQGRKLNAADYFPTPSALADTLVKMNEVNASEFAWDMCRDEDLDAQGRVTILEPSAGDGALVDAFLRYADKGEMHLNARIIMIESDPLRAELLRIKYLDKVTPGVKFDVIEGDFTKINQSDLGGPVDAVLMNPPFKDWDEHYRHASSLIRENGYISAILPELAGAGRMRGQKADLAIDLLAEAACNNGVIEENSAGAFANHDKKRGAAIKTNVKTDIHAKQIMADTPACRSSILDYYNLSASSHRPVYQELMKNIGIAAGTPADSDEPIAGKHVPEIIKLMSEYLKNNRFELVSKEMLPIHSSIPMDTYAASITMTIAEDRLTPAATESLAKVISAGITGKDVPQPSPAPTPAPAPEIVQPTPIADPGQSSFGF